MGGHLRKDRLEMCPQMMKKLELQFCTVYEISLITNEVS